MEEIDTLIAKSREAQANSFSPYSHFRVGAAFLARDGRVYSGCNIESSSYGLTICAERVALYKAISEGNNQFSALVIVTDTEDFCPPCGACRQVIWDFVKDLEIILVNKHDERRQLTIQELYPHAFSSTLLSKKDRRK